MFFSGLQILAGSHLQNSHYYHKYTLYISTMEWQQDLQQMNITGKWLHKDSGQKTTVPVVSSLNLDILQFSQYPTTRFCQFSSPKDHISIPLLDTCSSVRNLPVQMDFCRSIKILRLNNCSSVSILQLGSVSSITILVLQLDSCRLVSILHLEFCSLVSIVIVLQFSQYSTVHFCSSVSFQQLIFAVQSVSNS